MCTTLCTGERRECVRVLGALGAAAILEVEGWAVGTGKVFLKASQQQQLEVS